MAQMFNIRTLLHQYQYKPNVLHPANHFGLHRFHGHFLNHGQLLYIVLVNDRFHHYCYCLIVLMVDYCLDCYFDYLDCYYWYL